MSPKNVLFGNKRLGGGGINDSNFLLNITVDIKVVLFSLTHAGFILTWFVNFYAFLHILLCMY